MDRMKLLYRQVQDKIKGINFEALWEGFQSYGFALYTEEKVYLENRVLEKTDCFMGNTAIQFEGRQIAIWKIEEEFWKAKDVDLLAADMVHEMFHAFQISHGEKRFPNDIMALDYPDNVENFDLKWKENRVLVKAYQEKSMAEKHRLLSLFYGYRKKREDIIGDRIVYEYMVETLEGMAEYVGAKALKMLSNEKYRKRAEGYLRSLEEVSTMLFDVRRLSYVTGVVLLMTCSEGEFDIHHKISVEKRPVFSLLTEQNNFVKEIEPIPSSVEDQVQKIFLQVQEDKKSRITAFFQNGHVECVGEYSIEGYDPMNMFKIDGMIYGKYFWMLRDQKTGEQLFIKGEGILLCDEEGGICKYWKRQIP